MRALLRQALAETPAPAGWVPATPMRDELPHVAARLTPRAEAHLFEVQLPATGS